MMLGQEQIFTHRWIFLRQKRQVFQLAQLQQQCRVLVRDSISSLEIDKDSSGNIPVGQQSLVLEYVEVTSGVSEVITVTGFSGSTTGGTYSVTIDGTTVTTAAQANNASAGAVAAALDTALSAAGISVDVTSSNASGMTLHLQKGLLLTSIIR